MKKTAAGLLAAVLVAVVAACGSDDRAATATLSPTSVSAAPAPDSTWGFTVTTVRLEGEGYGVDLPQVAGGKADARTEFNDGMHAEADKFIQQAGPDYKVTGFRSEVTRIGAHVLSGVLGIEVDAGWLHPTTYKATHVTEIETGRPLALADVFTDLQQGLDALSAQAALLIPKTRVGTNTYTKQNIEPKVENFERWVAVPDGMRVYLGEIASHAMGYIDITVPWSALDGVLRPGLRAVLSS
ncbi:RsiV family protein [Nocardia australiensis]|uniref:RsiV family protein n=1 Tax=Nocardia australiensis TaxID=2887191 RepID=UPI001D157EE5|nr:RsiV family protein [Nocardia australiensis]